MSVCESWLFDSETGELHPALVKNLAALRAVVEDEGLVLVAVPKWTGDLLVVDGWLQMTHWHPAWFQVNGKAGKAGIIERGPAGEQNMIDQYPDKDGEGGDQNDRA